MIRLDTVGEVTAYERYVGVDVPSIACKSNEFNTLTRNPVIREP